MNFQLSKLLILPLFIGLSACVTTAVDLDADPKLAMSKGVLAGEFGTGLVGANKIKAVQAEHSALENGATGAALNWVGEEGVKGSVTPGQPYQVGTATCRTYTHILQISQQTRTARGTACKEQDADWVPLV